MNPYPVRNLILGPIFLAALASCSSGPTLVESPAIAIDAPEGVSYVTEVGFSEGSAQLDADDKKKLDQLIVQAHHAGHVEDVKVMSWADKAVPAHAKVELPDSEKSLAEQRNLQIKEYIQQTHAQARFDHLDIDTFNMARPPSNFNEYFKTQDARVKSSLSDPKTGKAMVFVLLKKIERD